MKNINSIRLIDRLAEITSHQDREIIEKSLLKTLIEYHSSQEYWLYQIMTVEPELSLGLSAYTSSVNVVTSEYPKKQNLPDYIEQGVSSVVQNGVVEVVKNPSSPQDIFIIYPARDTNGDVFAILIERTQSMDVDGQRLVHGFLRIFANYLDLIEQTRRDKLTGLLNRETLEQEITRTIILNNERIPPNMVTEPEVEQNARQHKGELQYWLGVLDIDHFKKINDTFGHLYGDEILILISRLMEMSVRDYDLIFRYGGEEFVILLRAFDLTDAKLAFERIRVTIGHHTYAKVDEVTASIGVTVIASQTGPAAVIAEADQAMYYAKENGRDQIRFYSDLIAVGAIEKEEQEIEPGGISFF
jgi:diguanylate cyclase (GGDEF)-like protein